MRRARTYLPGGILALGCVLIFSSREQQSMPLARPLSSLPAEIEGYQGADVKISDDEQQVAGMSSYMFRVFRRESTEGFSIYVGYYEYQTQGKSIHSPKNCLPGAGWDFVQTGRTDVATGTGPVQVNRSVVHNGTARALVYYWYEGRGRVAANEYLVKWDLLRDAALHGRTEEALVRIVVPISRGASAEAGLAAAEATATSVASQLIGDVATVMPRWRAS
jgi:EpsI family protein